MSEEFGNDFITLTDEDGNEFELEHIDTLELGGQTYMAFLPAEEMDSDEASELVLLKASLAEDGEEILVSLDDEAEEAELYDLFADRLGEQFEFEN